MARARLRLWLLYALLCGGAGLAVPAPVSAQASADRSQEGSFWLGYFSDWALQRRWSVWFDTQYAWSAFALLRAGLTYQFLLGPRLTTGYAQVWTGSSDGQLTRNEFRPWAQVFLPYRYSDRWSVSQRLRWDCRIRENVENGQLVAGLTTVQRARFQTAVSFYFEERKRGQPFVQVADEVLINLGQNAGPNFLDQNRVSLLFGFRAGAVTVLTGYMDRFVPGMAGSHPLHQHLAVLWVSHSIKPRDDAKTNPELPEARHP